MPAFQTRTENTRDDWQTPDYILNAFPGFDLDPSANCEQPTRCAERGLTFADNGLDAEWSGRVWLNPPYGADCKLWMKRLADHGNGIALIPPRMGSAWFHEIVLSRANALFFLKGRVSFIRSDTGKPVSGNNADSVLVAFGDENAALLKACSLRGRYVSLNSPGDM